MAEDNQEWPITRTAILNSEALIEALERECRGLAEKMLAGFGSGGNSDQERLEHRLSVKLSQLADTRHALSHDQMTLSILRGAAERKAQAQG